MWWIYEYVCRYFSHSFGHFYILWLLPITIIIYPDTYSLVVRSLLGYSRTIQLPFQLAHFPLAINLRSSGSQANESGRKNYEPIHSWSVLALPQHPTRACQIAHENYIFNLLHSKVFMRFGIFLRFVWGAFMPGMLLQFSLFVGPESACCRLHIFGVSVCVCC